MMKAAIFQVPYPARGKIAETRQWILERLSGLNTRIDLILLPEYSNCLGAEGRDEILDSVRGEGKTILKACRDTAERTGAIVMAGVVTEGADGFLRNQLMVVDSEKEPLFPYTKNYPVEAEFQEGFIPGKGPEVFEINGVRFGAAICFDFYFPDLFTNYLKKKIDVLLLPTLQRRESAERLHYLTRARAFDCGCTILRSSVVMPGRTDIAGCSMAVGPDGNIIADAGAVPCVLLTEFDPHARFVQPASYDRPDAISDYRETRLHVRKMVLDALKF